MRILVTGAAGFIGSHLSEALLVVHLAAKAGVRPSLFDPDAYIETV